MSAARKSWCTPSRRKHETASAAAGGTCTRRAAHCRPRRGPRRVRPGRRTGGARFAPSVFHAHTGVPGLTSAGAHCPWACPAAAAGACGVSKPTHTSCGRVATGLVATVFPRWDYTALAHRHAHPHSRPASVLCSFDRRISRLRKASLRAVALSWPTRDTFGENRLTRLSTRSVSRHPRHVRLPTCPPSAIYTRTVHYSIRPAHGARGWRTGERARESSR